MPSFLDNLARGVRDTGMKNRGFTCDGIADKRTPFHVMSVILSIDVKTFCLRFFILVTFLRFLTFFILSTFLLLKTEKRWQNRRVSKRKDGNEIIQFNNIIHFPVSYGSVEFSGLQILKYCIQ